MATNTEPVKPQKSRKLIIIATAVVALAMVGAAVAYFLKGDHKPKESIALPVTPIFITLDPFTVNLQADSKARFLHIGMTLKVADFKAQTELNQYLPEVRSRVLMVLSNRQSEALTSATDKAQLATELMTALNRPLAANLPPQRISSVMFTTFMLQ